MPRLGWAMEEGTLVEWRLADGSPVAAGDVLCIIESDKAENEVESFDAGVLRIPPGSPPPGTRVPVGTLLGYILRPGEALPAAPPPAAPPRRDTAGAAATPAAVGGPAAGRGQPAISPRARRVARELDVDWRGLSGSGRTGRIRERDVRAAAVRPARPHPAGTSAGRAIRRRIAERMARSARAAAPVTLTTEVDATALVALRSELARAGSPAPAYTDLLVKLVATALREHPGLNASLVDGEVVEHAEIHIAVAVDTERGLLAPVVRGASDKPLAAVAAEVAALTEAARDGRLRPEQQGGATFTVTNLGMYGIDAFTPIVNVPECAVLGVGRIVARPVVVDEAAATVAVRRMLTLSLTFDHRVVDGAPAARVLQRVGQLVTAPAEALGR